MRQKIYTLLIMSVMTVCAMAETMQVKSPDGRLTVDFTLTDGRLTYAVSYDNNEMIQSSALGVNTEMGDYTQGLTLKDVRHSAIDETYTLRTAKCGGNHYVANKIEIDLTAASKFKRVMTLTMQVSNNDIAFKYDFSGAETTFRDEPRRTTVYGEATSFNMPAATTTFICPQTTGDHYGWMSTKPSYEEEYVADDVMNKPSRFGKGYTFPCLFRVGDKGWVLISETGVGSNYCGSHLSDYKEGTGYTVAYPDETENHGLGSAFPAIMLPGGTPWRTITVGASLAPVAETTVAYDVVKPLYEPREVYKAGRYTWSWLIWQDNSVNYDDQVSFINTAAAMGYEYCLVDGWWDTQIGRERIEELSRYARSKGVSLMLWYNSNGYINDAPQGPRGGMHTSIAREREMAWMEKIGVKGIKVDFFGGDKQQTMQLYEDILSDANRHGIQVIFHGCTLPRGWERMYPNYVASEAVLASENVYFTEHHAQREGFELTLHPFCRNAVASMDWGGTIMNRYMSRDNKSRHRRYTSDTFEMAASIINQTSIQCICLQESNLSELKDFQLEFLRNVPVTWQETKYIDGYPTKYVVMARKATNQRWYVSGLNGESQPRTLTLRLPMLAGKTVTLYTDEPQKKGELWPTPAKRTVKVGKNGDVKVTMQPMGGVIIVE